MSRLTISNTDLIVVTVAIGIALIVFVAFSIWSRRFGSAAVEKWAREKGWQVVSVRRRSFVPHWRGLSSKRCQFFRVTVQNRDGGNHEGWIRLESDCTEPKVVDVIWNDKVPG